MPNYVALVHKDIDSDYGVSFPDLPGLISAGRDLDEARKMAAEALAFYLDGLAADGESPPKPSSLEEVTAMADNAENKDVIAIVIEVAGAR